jgi:hypothetical protein
MKAITIPRSLSRQGDLVVIPRKEYEELLELKRVREFTLTGKQRAALKRSERNLNLGKTLSLNAAAKSLGFTD